MSNNNNDTLFKLYCGDNIEVMEREIPDKSINMVMYSPQYWHKKGIPELGPNQQGLERYADDFVDNLVKINKVIYRKLKDDGSLYINIDDSYNGRKRGNSNGLKSQHSTIGGQKKGVEAAHADVDKYPQEGYQDQGLLFLPFKLADRLHREVGFVPRTSIIWEPPNGMPNWGPSRFSTVHEYILYFTKKSSGVYHNSLREIDKFGNLVGADPKTGTPRYIRSVWRIYTKQLTGVSHYTPYARDICIPPIKASCPIGGVVMDPFMGSGTTGVAAVRLGRRFIGIDQKQQYQEIADTRIREAVEENRLHGYERGYDNNLVCIDETLDLRQSKRDNEAYLTQMNQNTPTKKQGLTYFGFVGDNGKGLERFGFGGSGGSGK